MNNSKYPKELKEIAEALNVIMKKHGNLTLKKLWKDDGTIAIGFNGISDIITHENNEAMKEFFNLFISETYQ